MGTPPRHYVAVDAGVSGSICVLFHDPLRRDSNSIFRIELYDTKNADVDEIMRTYIPKAKGVFLEKLQPISHNNANASFKLGESYGKLKDYIYSLNNYRFPCYEMRCEHWQAEMYKGIDRRQTKASIKKEALNRFKDILDISKVKSNQREAVLMALYLYRLENGKHIC